MTKHFFDQQAYRLGDFVVDPLAGVISTDGRATQLQPKVTQLLQCLVANHGQVVSKEYLLEHVWEGVFVVDGALRRCIFLLRKALADAQGNQQHLETLPRRGYRLLLAPEPLETTQALSAEGSATIAGPAYRGLQVFENAHADIFFGRQAATQQVVDALDAQLAAGRAFCLILGPSGSGKSSLARAGVVPALLEKSLQIDNKTLLPMVFQISDSQAQLLDFFAAKLVETIGSDEADDLGVTRLAEQLRDDEDAGLSAILARLTGEGVRLLLLFDQFEELFSLQNIADADRQRIISVLYALVRSGCVWVVATLRIEFYPQFSANETLRFLKGNAGQVDLVFPGAAEIAEIVRRPAELVGLSFDADRDNRRLDEIIIDDATRQPNSLPLLQFALRELEMSASDKTLRVADYKALGSLEGCLSGHAERVFAALPPIARAALPAVLERMVIADPRNAGRVLKRTIRLADFADVPGGVKFSEAFINARLMTTFLDKSSGAPSAQFAHEAVLVNWSRARDWVQRNYAEIRFRSWLTELATRWADDGRPKHYLLSDGKPLLEASQLTAKPTSFPDHVVDFVAASNRRASFRGAGRGVVTIALLVLSLTALVLWQTAERSSAKAQRASLRAQATNDFMLSIFENANTGNTGGVELTPAQLLDRARSELAGSMENEPANRADMLSKLGETYLLMGQYDVADELFSQAEQLLPDIQSDSPEVASKVLLELGAIRNTQARYTESARYLASALEMAEQAGDYLLVAHSKNLQGLLAQSQGDYAGAAVLFADAQGKLDLADAAAPATIKLRPSLFNNQGIAALRLGELGRAGEAFDNAMSLRRQNGLDQSADQTDVLSNMGALRRLQGKHAEAITFFSQAVALRTKLHGALHPKNAQYLVNQAAAELSAERYNDAVGSARQGLEVVNAGSGHDATVVALLHGNLAIASWLARRPLESERLATARDELETLTTAYGESHDIVLRVRVATAALALDNDAEAGTSTVTSRCSELARLAATMAGNESGQGVFQQRLNDYLVPGARCAQR